jgi:hypothetical protein
MELVLIKLSEVSQAQKDKYHMSSCKQNIKKLLPQKLK